MIMTSILAHVKTSYCHAFASFAKDILWTGAVEVIFQIFTCSSVHTWRFHFTNIHVYDWKFQWLSRSFTYKRTRKYSIENVDKITINRWIRKKLLGIWLLGIIDKNPSICVIFSHLTGIFHIPDLTDSLKPSSVYMSSVTSLTTVFEFSLLIMTSCWTPHNVSIKFSSETSPPSNNARRCRLDSSVLAHLSIRFLFWKCDALT